MTKLIFILRKNKEGRKKREGNQYTECPKCRVLCPPGAGGGVAGFQEDIVAFPVVTQPPDAKLGTRPWKPSKRGSSLWLSRLFRTRKQVLGVLQQKVLELSPEPTCWETLIASCKGNPKI